MLDLGYSRRSVESVLNRLERDIINSGISERQQQQMASGFNYQAARNNCALRYRYLVSRILFIPSLFGRSLLVKDLKADNCFTVIVEI